MAVVVVAAVAAAVTGGALGASGTASATHDVDVEVDAGVVAALSAGGDVAVIVALAVEPASGISTGVLASADGVGGPSPDTDADAARIAALQTRVVAALAPADFRLAYRYRHIPALAGQLTRTGLDTLSARSEVVAVALDPPLEIYLDQSVPFIGGDKVHRQGFQGSGVQVAVLDTGVDTGGTDLRDAIVAEACFITPASLCPAAPHVSEDSDGHGTSVTGIVASRGRQAPKGVAPAAEIVSIKLIEERNNAAGSATLAAFDWILDRGDVDVMNMSFGSGAYEGVCDDANAYTRSLAQATVRLRAKGIVPVAASGNDKSQTKMGAPACIGGVVSVGAVQDYEEAGGANAKVTEFTNRNATLDMLAPGAGIQVAGLGSRLQSNFSGTSAAAPHVAGAFALLRQAAPWAGPDLLEDVLERTGGRPTLRYGSTTISTIRIDAALRELLKITPTATGPSGTRSSTPTPTPSETATRPPSSATPIAAATLTPPATASVTPSRATASSTASVTMAGPTSPASPTEAPSPTLTPARPPSATASSSPAATTDRASASPAPSARLFLPVARRESGG